MSLINKISLVIFDMDGLMFDTEKLAIHTWIKAGKRVGIDITEEIVFESMGLDVHGAEQVFKKHLGEDFPYYMVRDLRLDYTQKYVEQNGVPVKKALYELLELLDEKSVAKAVATSTERERTEQLLQSAGVADRFEVVICGNDVSKGKPAPDIFLAVARELDYEPRECLVLEDSVNGIIAAFKANMMPVLVTDMKTSEEIEEIAIKKFKSLREVKKFLESVNL